MRSEIKQIMEFLAIKWKYVHICPFGYMHFAYLHPCIFIFGGMKPLLALMLLLAAS